MTTLARSSTLEFGTPSELESGLSAMARGLRGSIILRIAADIRALVAAGHPLCNLTVGDFDPRQFPIPTPLRDRTIEALRAGETNYPPSDGMLPLRESVVQYIHREHGVEYPVPSVLITAGGRPAIYAVYRCMLDQGDTVLYSVPSWNNDYYAEIVGARKIAVRAGAAQRFQPTVDDLTPRLSAATLLCLCSPGNPTGTVIEPEALRAILEAVVEENHRRASRRGRPLWVLYDLMYGSLILDGEAQAHPLALVPEAAPWVVTVDGISKAFAGTGLRVGWATGAPAVMARLNDFLGHVGAWAPRPEQIATAGFLREPAAIREFRATMRKALASRFGALTEGFLAMKRDGLPVDCVQPQGAMYVSLGVDLVGKQVNGRPVPDDEALRTALLHEAGLAAVPFQAFGVPEHSGWFRLAVGAVSVEAIGAMLPRVRGMLEAG